VTSIMICRAAGLGVAVSSERLSTSGQGNIFISPSSNGSAGSWLQSMVRSQDVKKKTRVF
jgi:hypothetical protein